MKNVSPYVLIIYLGLLTLSSASPARGHKLYLGRSVLGSPASSLPPAFQLHSSLITNLFVSLIVFFILKGSLILSKSGSSFAWDSLPCAHFNFLFSVNMLILYEATDDPKIT